MADPAAPSPSPGIAAGLLRRLAALNYEALLVTAVLFVAGFALAPFVSPRPAGVPNALIVPRAGPRQIAFVAFVTLLGAYFVWFWSEGRQTLAQKTWRIVLARAGGGALTRRAAFVRYLACWAGPFIALAAYLLLRPFGLGAYAVWLVALNWLWAMVDPDRQFLHDRIACTRLLVAAP